MALRFFDTKSPSKSAYRVAAGLLACAFISSPVFADEPAVSKSEAGVVDETKADGTPAPVVSPFHGVAAMNLRSSTTSNHDYDYQLFLAPSLFLEYSYSDTVSFGLSARARKDLINEYKATMTDLTASASKTFAFTQDFGLGLDVFYSAPVSKDIVKYDNAKGTLGGTSSFGYKFTNALEGLALNAGVGYERYMYQYQYSNGGRILAKWSFSQNYGVSYTWRKLTASITLANYTSYDFDGSQERDSFLAVETLAYKIDDDWSVQAGYINDGNTYDYLGASNNIRIYDKRRTQIFIGTSYRFSGRENTNNPGQPARN